MPEMATAVRADDLRPGHSERAVCVSCHRAWDAIEVCGPSAAGLEFVGCRVEGRIASGAGVDAFFRHVLVIFPSEWSFGSLFTQDAKLFCDEYSVSHSCEEPGTEYLAEDIPLLRTACHSWSDFWTG